MSLRYRRGAVVHTRQKRVEVGHEADCDNVLLLSGALGICSALDITCVCALEGQVFRSSIRRIARRQWKLEVQDSDAMAFYDAGQRDEPGDDWQEMRLDTTSLIMQ